MKESIRACPMFRFLGTGSGWKICWLRGYLPFWNFANINRCFNRLKVGMNKLLSVSNCVLIWDPELTWPSLTQIKCLTDCVSLTTWWHAGKCIPMCTCEWNKGEVFFSTRVLTSWVWEEKQKLQKHFWQIWSYIPCEPMFLIGGM